MSDGSGSEAGDGQACMHNHWDNIRVKKGIVTLACRYCKQKWKLPHPIPNKCPDFYRGYCPFGPHCPYLHIHRFKSKAKSPDPSNYSPDVIIDATFRDAAQEVLNRHEPNTSPSAIYEEVIIAFAVKQQDLNRSGQSTGSGWGDSSGGSARQPQAVPIAPAAADDDDDFGLTVDIPSAQQQVTTANGLAVGTPASAGRFATTPGTPITRRYVPQMREMDNNPPTSAGGGKHPTSSRGGVSPNSTMPAHLQGAMRGMGPGTPGAYNPYGAPRTPPAGAPQVNFGEMWRNAKPPSNPTTPGGGYRPFQQHANNDQHQQQQQYHQRQHAHHHHHPGSNPTTPGGHPYHYHAPPPPPHQHQHHYPQQQQHQQQNSGDDSNYFYDHQRGSY